MKNLAISILNRNSVNDTILCINSLLESQFQDFDIYLLDNWSRNNEYKKLCELFSWKWNTIINHSEENLWFTWGNNFNLWEIWDKYEYVLLLNNDTIIPKDFLGKFILKCGKISNWWIFWPEIRNIDNTPQSIWNKLNLYSWASKRYKTYDEKNLIDYISWSCFFIKYEVIKEIWFLDDNFFAYYEESDFCLRAKKLWYYTYVIPECFIYHKEETANKKEKPYYCYLMFRNRILFLKKHSNLFQYFISYLFLVAYLIMFFPTNFWLKNYKYAFKWIIDGIKWIWWKPNI